MGRDARQSSADEARNLLAAADNVVSLGIRRPQEGEAHAKEAVLSRPTPDTKLGLTLTDLGDGQVVIHQVYEGYKAACLQASDFVISVNGELVDTEPQATRIAATSTGDLKLQLRAPVGARSVKVASWPCHSWLPSVIHARQAASEGFGLPSAPVRSDPSPQVPPRGRGLGARPCQTHGFRRG